MATDMVLDFMKVSTLNLSTLMGMTHYLPSS